MWEIIGIQPRINYPTGTIRPKSVEPALYYRGTRSVGSCPEPRKCWYWTCLFKYQGSLLLTRKQHVVCIWCIARQISQYVACMYQQQSLLSIDPYRGGGDGREGRGSMKLAFAWTPTGHTMPSSALSVLFCPSRRWLSKTL